jgi:hypothetical protein
VGSDPVGPYSSTVHLREPLFDMPRRVRRSNNPGYEFRVQGAFEHGGLRKIHASARSCTGRKGKSSLSVLSSHIALKILRFTPLA